MTFLSGSSLTALRAQNRLREWPEMRAHPQHQLLGFTPNIAAWVPKPCRRMCHRAPVGPPFGRSGSSGTGLVVGHPRAVEVPDHEAGADRVQRLERREQRGGHGHRAPRAALRRGRLTEPRLPVHRERPGDQVDVALLSVRALFESVPVPQFEGGPVAARQPDHRRRVGPVLRGPPRRADRNAVQRARGADPGRAALPAVSLFER
jgi:hypothetical protein